MRLLILLAFIVTLTTSRLCTKPTTIQIDISTYKIPKTNSYRFAFDIKNQKILLNKNNSGIAFVGNVSTLVLKNQQSKEFIFDSVEFGFECPALHKPTKSKEQLIELQIIHKYRPSSQENGSISSPYEWILFSFPFMVSEYVPENSLSVSKLLEAVESNKAIDLREVLKQKVSGQTLVYTTRQWRFGQKSILRMIRKQIRLMSKDEFLKLKHLIQDGVQLQTNDISIKPMGKSPQKIYQIKSYSFEQSSAFRKQDL